MENNLLNDLVAEVDRLSAKDCRASYIWKPETVGDSLHGTVVKMETVNGRYGVQTKLTIRTATGDELTRYCSKGEVRQLRNRGTKVGDEILLKCKDIERMRNGKDHPIIGVVSRSLSKPNGAGANSSDSPEAVFEIGGGGDIPF